MISATITITTMHDYGLDHERHKDGLWQSDNVELISVGIDIGSSGTQVVFSASGCSGSAIDLSSRCYVGGTRELYQLPVSLTPYGAGLMIDKHALARIIDDAYDSAGITPENVDTGAVILTGEALRRENAENIGNILATWRPIRLHDGRTPYRSDAGRLRLGRGMSPTSSRSGF